ncbi:YhcH/YjgK/YiaL family protein [candidate division KSB1 bacterium]|nr:YhcH/YjgK/YiaL family protein [candidate division KSB1 bacterium]
MRSSSTETIAFKTLQFEIVGHLHMPGGPEPHPAIIIVHGDGRGTRGYYRAMREKFNTAGYATFIWDKPGFGESKGPFSDDSTLTERAAILLHAIRTLKTHPRLNPDRIGVWGVSQAGYVIPLALQQGADIAFMILVGAPGEDGVQQTAYFVSRQILCEGASEIQAMEADSLAAGVLRAQTYEEYVAYGRTLLDRYPLVKVIDFMAGILPRERWSPRKRDGESFFNPMPIIARTPIPALVFYGELDKNVDPIQGAAAYRTALAKAGNEHSQVVLLPEVDHDMVPCKTGCMRERNNRSSWRVHPEYLDGMIKWLKNTEKGTMKTPIVDRLENWQKYAHLHPAFSRAFAFLNDSHLAELALTKHDIEVDQLYCTMAKRPGRTRAESPLEAHQKYIDIQYVISGEDEMGWKPQADCQKVKRAYDAERDIIFYSDEPEQWIKVPAGSFIIFFPQDAHAPLVSDGEIHKAVIKVAVE